MGRYRTFLLLMVAFLTAGGASVVYESSATDAVSPEVVHRGSSTTQGQASAWDQSSTPISRTDEVKQREGLMHQPGLSRAGDPRLRTVPDQDQPQARQRQSHSEPHVRTIADSNIEQAVPQAAPRSDGEVGKRPDRPVQSVPRQGIEVMDGTPVGFPFRPEDFPKGLAVRVKSATPVVISVHGAGAGAARLNGKPMEEGQQYQVMDGDCLTSEVSVGVHLRPTSGASLLAPEGPG